MLRKAMDLAGEQLRKMICSEHNYVPFYEVQIDEQMRAWAWLWGLIHDIGRWWDAMCRLEDATAFSIPAEIESAMLENIEISFDNPDHLFLFPMDDSKFPRWCHRTYLEYHSMREGLLALTALVNSRDSRWAAETGRKMIETVLRISDTGQGPWKVDLLDRWRRIDPRPGRPISRTVLDSGRFMEALMFFHQATGDEAAVELADRFARIHLELNTWDGGEFHNDWATNHSHSYLGTLRGLLLFGEVTKQREYIDRVAETYRNSVRCNLVTESGFIGHDVDKETGGDPAAAGDSAQIALWLARNGHGEFLDDVARLVRARLLPAQLTECPPLSPMPLRKAPDGKQLVHVNVVSLEDRIMPAATALFPENMNEMAIGGWGIYPGAHWGKRATTDVSCAVLHTLCDVYNHIVVADGDGLTVNFHFDYEDDDVRIVARRGEAASVQIATKKPGRLRVRVPAWAPDDSLRVRVGGGEVAAVRSGAYLYLGNFDSPVDVEISHALPVRTTSETTNEQEFTFKWRGDEIVGISPNSSFLPFHPDLE